MITGRFSTLMLCLSFFSCPRPVDECPESGCVEPSTSLTLSQACLRARTNLFCNDPQRCGLADPSVSCDAINKNARFESEALCWLQEREAVDAGRLRYDGAAARACLTGLEARACFSTATVPACERIFTGLQQLGAECFSGPECVAGAWCDRTSTCPGRCTALVPPGGLARDLIGCAPGNAAVDQRDGGWLCRAPVSSGARCRQPGENVFGTSCLSSTESCSLPADGGAGFCEPWRTTLQPRGGTCGGGQFCQRGLACRFVPGETTGRCQDLIPLGQSCQLDFNGCALGATCGTDERCVPEPRVGEACTSTCARGARCVNAVCVAEGGVGGACPCEFGLRCVDGRCQTRACD